MSDFDDVDLALPPPVMGVPASAIAEGVAKEVTKPAEATPPKAVGPASAVAPVAMEDFAPAWIEPPPVIASPNATADDSAAYPPPIASSVSPIEEFTSDVPPPIASSVSPIEEFTSDVPPPVAPPSISLPSTSGMAAAPIDVEPAIAPAVTPPIEVPAVIPAAVFPAAESAPFEAAPFEAAPFEAASIQVGSFESAGLNIPPQVSAAVTPSAAPSVAPSTNLGDSIPNIVDGLAPPSHLGGELSENHTEKAGLSEAVIPSVVRVEPPITHEKNEGIDPASAKASEPPAAKEAAPAGGAVGGRKGGFSPLLKTQLFAQSPFAAQSASVQPSAPAQQFTAQPASVQQFAAPAPAITPAPAQQFTAQSASVQPSAPAQQFTAQPASVQQFAAPAPVITPAPAITPAPVQQFTAQPASVQPSAPAQQFTAQPASVQQFTAPAPTIAPAPVQQFTASPPAQPAVNPVQPSATREWAHHDREIEAPPVIPASKGGFAPYASSEAPQYQGNQHRFDASVEPLIAPPQMVESSGRSSSPSFSQLPQQPFVDVPPARVGSEPTRESQSQLSRDSALNPWGQPPMIAPAAHGSTPGVQGAVGAPTSVGSPAFVAQVPQTSGHAPSSVRIAENGQPIDAAGSNAPAEIAPIVLEPLQKLPWED